VACNRVTKCEPYPYHTYLTLFNNKHPILSRLFKTKKMDPSISTSPRSSSSPSGTASSHSSRTPTPLTGKKRPREESGFEAIRDLQHQVTPQREIGTNSQNLAMNNGNYLSSTSENQPKITSTSSSSGEHPRQSQQPETGTSATLKSTENNLPEKEKRGASADDLLVPLADFDWTGFEAQCKADQQSVDGEEVALLEEFHSWVWVSSPQQLAARDPSGLINLGLFLSFTNCG